MAFETKFPPRLSEGDDRRAELIRRALAEPVLGPSEQRSWQRLSSRSKPALPRLLLPAVAVGLALTAFALWHESPRADSLLKPEVLPHAALPRASAEPSNAPAPPVAAPASSERHKVPRADSSPSAVASATEADAAPCATLAKAAAYVDATDCYARIARGSSMTSELALYEKARLEAKALGKPSLALTTLDEHTRRFPGGVLRSEVAFTRIDLLSQLGRRAEALAAIDESLHGALGQERAGDLQAMRAGLLAANRECAAALEAAQAARQAGVHPSRLEAVERRCPTAAPAASAAETP